VVGDRIPHSAATAVLPPFTGPGRRRHLHGVVLKTLGRITGNRIEAPQLLAGSGVVSGGIAARATGFSTTVADDDFAVEGTRRAADVAGFAFERLHLPGQRALGGVERDQAAVISADVDAAIPVGNAAIRRKQLTLALAAMAPHFGVVTPQ